MLNFPKNNVVIKYMIFCKVSVALIAVYTLANKRKA